MSGPQWSQFSVQNGKRKRAGFACDPCHAKKTKCDLEIRNKRGYERCSHCTGTTKECRPRPSKRETHRSLHRSSPVALYTLVQNPDWNLSPLKSRHTSIAVSNVNDANAWKISAGNVSLSANVQTDNQALASSKLADAGTNANFGLVSPEPTNKNALPSSTRPENALLAEPTTTDLIPTVTSNERVSAIFAHSLDFGENERRSPRVPEEELNPLFVETFFEYCYTWCPVLNESNVFQELRDSSLLQNAIATLGTNLRPPDLSHESAATYYDIACKKLFANEEPNLMPTLKSIMLFYWYAPQPPSPMNRNSSWWWTSMVIRHAQQAGIHNDFSTSHTQSDADHSLHRRVWWTVFSRERLTAFCQGKPCVIVPEDCEIPELSLADFPASSDKDKAEVFIYWVRLCAIIGRLAREMSRSAKARSDGPSFPTHLAKELIKWHRSLPLSLQLPFTTSYTLKYNRDIHQLHLCYLATVLILHFARPLQAPSVPKALTPAIVAASCIARILKEVMMRREIRYFMPITCWYCGTAFTALLQGSRIANLSDDANTDMRIITTVIKQLKDHWGTANVYDKWFDKLRSVDKSVTAEEFPNLHMMNERSVRPLQSEESVIVNGINWQDYFPFLTAETTPLAGKLLDQQDLDQFQWENVGEFSAFQFQDFMEDFESWGQSALSL